MSVLGIKAFHTGGPGFSQKLWVSLRGHCGKSDKTVEEIQQRIIFQHRLLSNISDNDETYVMINNMSVKDQ